MFFPSTGKVYCTVFIDFSNCQFEYISLFYAILSYQEKMMDDSTTTQPHKRRVRYTGTHPHTFAEKYKELNPEKYKEDIQHIISRGDTPAGTHRPVCMQEVLTILDPKPGETAVDATLGYGGHAREILKRIQPGGILYGLDVDSAELPKTESRIRTEGFGPESFVAVHANFEALLKILPTVGHPSVDMILADLGVSSMQIDNPERGFTFKTDGPLDMRMDQSKGETAAHLLSRITEGKIAFLLRNNADEPDAGILAHAIFQNRQQMVTTGALSGIIKETLTELNRSERDIIKSERRVYQALRIDVNEEFQALETFLADLPYCLKSGGRVVILTFHSGEDCRVVRAFEEGEQFGIYSHIQNCEIRESKEERFSNPRSRSVRLRWAIRS
jgi:16S rRNA (cytosine1402-N4)-methyltransferase